jgi:cyanate permease
MLKRYIVFLFRPYVDKYLLIILTMLCVGMVFAMMQTPFNLVLFYGQLAGALVIIAYTTIKNRRTTPRAKRR